MLKFPFLVVGFRKTVNDIFKLVGEKKMWSGKNGEFQIASPIDTLPVYLIDIPIGICGYHILFTNYISVS